MRTLVDANDKTTQEMSGRIQETKTMVDNLNEESNTFLEEIKKI